ncbi:MAG: hypothetical protein AB7G44_07510 [Bacteroidia bacterium]
MRGGGNTSLLSTQKKFYDSPAGQKTKVAYTACNSFSTCFISGLEKQKNNYKNQPSQTSEVTFSSAFSCSLNSEPQFSTAFTTSLTSEGQNPLAFSGSLVSEAPISIAFYRSLISEAKNPLAFKAHYPVELNPPQFSSLHYPVIYKNLL